MYSREMLDDDGLGPGPCNAFVEKVVLIALGCLQVNVITTDPPKSRSPRKWGRYFFSLHTQTGLVPYNSCVCCLKVTYHWNNIDQLI